MPLASPHAIRRGDRRAAAHRLCRPRGPRSLPRVTPAAAAPPSHAARASAPAADEIRVIELSRRRRRDVSRFLRVPYPIYAKDPNWVAPLLADLRTVFADANPLFEHAEMTLWVATRGGRDVGRIAGVLDAAHNDMHKEATAFWGFFESVDDPAVAAALFGAVADWARAKGMAKLLGPMNPTSNDECGLLVEGFDRPPVVMMPYNPRYYVDLVEGQGFAKAKDLLAYHFYVGDKPLARLTRVADGVQRREPGLVVRPIRRKTLFADLAAVKEVYNAAWEQNWGFVPMTDAELNFMAKRLKPLLDEGLALLAEDKGEPVAFMLSLPDWNVALQPLRGRLLTPKIFNFLLFLLRKKRPTMARVITLGVKQSHRGRGVEGIMLAQSLKAGLAMGLKETEISWLLEDNVMVIRTAEIFDGKRYKTYRLYERAV